MNDHNTKLFLLAQAELARVEGMKADNRLDEIRGDYPRHDGGSFERSAEIIASLADLFIMGGSGAFIARYKDQDG